MLFVSAYDVRVGLPILIVFFVLSFFKPGTFRPKRFTLTFLADEGALREMTGGHPVEMSSIEITNETSCIQYARTARSETTFAGDYCCMMGNWKIKKNINYET